MLSSVPKSNGISVFISETTPNNIVISHVQNEPIVLFGDQNEYD